jgi:hypothetical protein
MSQDENLLSVLTNSKNLIPVLNNPFDIATDKPFHVGIDKVRVGFVLRPPFYRDLEAMQPYKKGLIAHWPMSEHAQFTLFTNTFKGVRRGFITFNPSRIIDPFGITCASWKDTQIATEMCAKIAYNEFFSFDLDINKLDIYRLDLTADFGPIADMQRVMHQAKTVKAFQGANPEVWFAPNGIDIETVYFKSATRGKFRIYDKTAQAGLPSPVLRVEYETTRKLHMAEGTPKVGDMTNEIVQRLFKSRLEPLIRALNPLLQRSVDKIIANTPDARTLIQICGREFLSQHSIYPPAGKTYLNNKRDFQKKYPYTRIEDIL